MSLTGFDGRVGLRHYCVDECIGSNHTVISLSHELGECLLSGYKRLAVLAQVRWNVSCMMYVQTSM